MPFKKKETDSSSEPWNVAKGFVFHSVLLPTGEINRLIKIARFGAETLEEATSIPKEFKAAARKEAIFRIHSLLMDTLISENEFAIKKKDAEKFSSYEERLINLSEKLEAITSKAHDQRDSSSYEEINEEHFTNCLKALIKIKREMNVELNNAELIFPSSEEFDLDRIKEEIMSGG